jgi:hypothetical protein
MFARIKKSGQYQYLQIVENSKIDGKVSQRSLPQLDVSINSRQKGVSKLLFAPWPDFRKRPCLFSPAKSMSTPMPSKSDRH